MNRIMSIRETGSEHQPDAGRVPEDIRNDDCRRESELRFTGRAVSPGYGEGFSIVHRDILSISSSNLAPVAIDGSDVDSEFDRLEEALAAVHEKLDLTHRRVSEEAGDRLASIFRAQQAMLKDFTLVDDLRSEMRQALLKAENIVLIVFRRLEERLRALSTGMFHDRGDDVADLCRCILMELTGSRCRNLADVPPGSVLVAERLLPSDIVTLPKGNVQGMVLESGGPASHAAILAREMGIPAVSRIAGVAHTLRDGESLLVDGMRGEVLVNPSAGSLAGFRRRKSAYRRIFRQAIRNCRLPACTCDGRTVRVMANIDSMEEACLAAEYGAAGVGLFRLELALMRMDRMPSSDELFHELLRCLAPLRDYPCTVRLLDAATDKCPPFIEMPAEGDSVVGLRGVRFLLSRPDLLRTQLRALLRLSTELETRILVPMVTLPEDMTAVRSMLRELAESMNIDQPPLGAMIETPAAALCVSDLAEVSDFFSIGTNDLTQYTMAADRGSDLVALYYRDDHEAVTRLLGMVVAERGDLPVSLCGNLAGNEEALPRLVDMGIRELSVAPSQIPVIKERVRRIRAACSSPDRQLDYLRQESSQP